MRRIVGYLSPILLLSSGCFAAAAQGPSKTSASALSAAEQATTLAENGHCPEALSVLARTVAQLKEPSLQKRAGLAGARCATLLQRWVDLQDFVRILNRQFPRDPEVLYVSVHAYSDLSSQAAEVLAQTAPDSIPGLEMDAEVNEMQGKWDQAEKDYRKALQKNPRYPGIHFRLARLLLSKPNPAPDFRDQAKRELQAELEINPADAGAEYVSGELARQAKDVPAAVQHFGQAAKLDPSFGDAYLGLGMSLLEEKAYQDAVTPLESAVKLEPGNPAAHFGLATAYARTGRKEAAEREFALQKQAAADTAAGEGANPQ